MSYPIQVEDEIRLQIEVENARVERLCEEALRLQHPLYIPRLQVIERPGVPTTVASSL